MGTTLPSIPAKRYFTIGEVAELCGVKPHVLRYWETQFSALKPMNSTRERLKSISVTPRGRLKGSSGAPPPKRFGMAKAAKEVLVLDGHEVTLSNPDKVYFPKAGITFWDCAHEGSGGMMADGFTRASGKMSMMIAQNGPGITNFVTAVKTAYWNHTPLLLVTPHAAN